MRFGVATGLRPLPAWKQEADFLFVQIGFDLDALLAWRSQVDVTCPVYAGVLVVPSVAMARNLTIPGLTVPPDLLARLEHDRSAGVEAACDLVLAIRDSGAFDGVHLIPVARYREVAARLERLLAPPALRAEMATGHAVERRLVHLDQRAHHQVGQAEGGVIALALLGDGDAGHAGRLGRQHPGRRVLPHQAAPGRAPAACGRP